MKFYVASSALVALLLVTLPPSSFAASDTEFGERFTNQTPAALQDTMTSEDLLAAETLSQIAPAAGENTQNAKEGDEPTSAPDQNQSPDPREQLGIEWHPAE